MSSTVNIRFAVSGTPVSLKARDPSKRVWQEKVKEAAQSAHSTGCLPKDLELSLTICDFPEAMPQGDVDNIIKRIQDAMNGVIYEDDKQIRRVVAHRFLPEDYENDAGLPNLVNEAIVNDAPFVYLAIRSDPIGDAL